MPLQFRQSTLWVHQSLVAVSIAKTNMLHPLRCRFRISEPLGTGSYGVAVCSVGHVKCVAISSISFIISLRC